MKIVVNFVAVLEYHANSAAIFTWADAEIRGSGQCLFVVFCVSRDMTFPTMWCVRPAKAQTSLPIWADWSEPLLVAWIFYDSWATDRTSFGVSMLKRRLHRLVWVYTCQNATLLEITCRGSGVFFSHQYISQRAVWGSRWGIMISE